MAERFSPVEQRLAAMLRELDEQQLELLERMAEALAVPVEVERPTSNLVDDPFANTLTNFLLMHHAIHEEPLNKAAFEYVLKACAEASGREAQLNPHQGSATWDVQIGSERWSLKTEAALGMSRATVKIEKLMEARWIRECTNPAKCATAVRREIPKHMEGYDRILVLRAFRLQDQKVRYDLVEPKADVLRQRLSSIDMDAFTKEGAKESYGANVETPGGERIFRILLDSSVEKVRLWFRLDQCVLHGSWRLTPADVQDAAIPTDKVAAD